jgi:hypothetical protein
MQFTVESRFVSGPAQGILAMLPAEQARRRELDALGLRLHLFLAADNSGSRQMFKLDTRGA